jgi:hypothetical protein
MTFHHGGHGKSPLNVSWFLTEPQDKCLLVPGLDKPYPPVMLSPTQVTTTWLASDDRAQNMARAIMMTDKEGVRAAFM